MADDLRLTLRPTLSGFGVEAAATPSKDDPLGQNPTRETFATLAEAIDALPRLARTEIARLGHGGQG